MGAVMTVERRKRLFTVADYHRMAETIRLFGSLARGTFGAGSDIDLAVEGIAERDLFRAQGRLLGLSTSFAIDLVDVRTARPALRRSIESEGVEL